MVKTALHATINRTVPFADGMGSGSTCTVGGSSIDERKLHFLEYKTYSREGCWASVDYPKVGKVPGSEKIKICFKIVTFKRFQRKIVTSKQLADLNCTNIFSVICSVFIIRSRLKIVTSEDFLKNS